MYHCTLQHHFFKLKEKKHFVLKDKVYVSSGWARTTVQSRLALNSEMGLPLPLECRDKVKNEKLKYFLSLMYPLTLKCLFEAN